MSRMEVIVVMMSGVMMKILEVEQVEEQEVVIKFN